MGTKRLRMDAAPLLSAIPMGLQKRGYVQVHGMPKIKELSRTHPARNGRYMPLEDRQRSKTLALRNPQILRYHIALYVKSLCEEVRVASAIANRALDNTFGLKVSEITGLFPCPLCRKWLQSVWRSMGVAERG